MAFDKVVDSAQLNRAMTYTAGRIREKTGETASIPWNATRGFGDAIDAIKVGSQKQIKVHTNAGASVTAAMGTQSVSGTADTNGICVLDVPENGEWTVSAVSGTQTATPQVVTVSDVFDVSVSFVSSTLNDNSWATIRAISDAGQGENYWSIGDCKEITLSGTVGELTLSNFTTYAFILGFNHNAEVEGNNRIHFQLSKTAISGGTDICLVSGYDDDSDFYMNTSNTNSGGWESSYMRTTILGTSLSSYSGTIIAVVPAALRAVLKSVTKYTDNYGGSSLGSSVTETTDYFFLLAEFEVFGSRSKANKFESSMQAQYAYYSTGKSKVKYKHDATTTASVWWLRSPTSGSSSNFTFVTTGGAVGSSNANASSGVAPGFCV